MLGRSSVLHPIPPKTTLTSELDNELPIEQLGSEGVFVHKLISSLQYSILLVPSEAIAIESELPRGFQGVLIG